MIQIELFKTCQKCIRDADGKFSEREHSRGIILYILELFLLPLFVADK